MSQKTLHQELAARGLSTRPADHGQKDIVNRAGVLLFTGRAHEVWEWMRKYDAIEQMSNQEARR